MAGGGECVRTALVCLLLWLGGSAGYNVDVESSVLYQGPPDSMFGFSVAAYSDRTNQWALVGAPRASTPQPGVTRGGAVYRCRVDPPTDEAARYRSCSQIPFDLNGNNVASNRTMDDKSDQWFGATVAAASGADNGGVVVACAPRYLWFSSNRKRREPVGTCFVAKDGFQQIDEYSPCRTDAWGYHRQGFCQAGLGSALSKSGESLFVGAVGSWYWQGRLFSQHLYSRPGLLGTLEGSSEDDDSYLGYSVAVGEFTGDQTQDVAVGMPRGNNLTGKVVLYSSALRPLVNISGAQIGAYFGYALAVADVDGDGRDDVVVGAPFHTDYSASGGGGGNFETGCIVVAYQTPGHNFKRQDYIQGKTSKSRFGLALSSLGDINQDGFEDVAVGAPNDGKNEDGAVFIFHGSKKGLVAEPTQVITPSALGLTSSPLLSLGYSIHGGVDLDQNQYPDIVVGAYDSDAAVYLRSRPVVHVRSQLNYQTGPEKLLDLSGRDGFCVVQAGREVPCVSLMFCMKYAGVGADKRAEFEVQFRLDVRRPRSPRMFFVDEPGRARINVTARAERNRLWCHERFVYVEASVRDKLTALVSEAHYSLVHRKPGGRRLDVLQPVLNLRLPPVAVDSVSIRKNCGRDDVCVPDLRLSARTSHDTYLLGSRERLTLEVAVTNVREDAFEAMFHLQLPIGVDYISADVFADSSSQAILCSLLERDTETLSCDVGNPLLANSTAHFLVNLMPKSTSEELQRHYRFNMSVNTTNPERRGSRADNQLTVALPIRIQTELIVTGISVPESVHYTPSRYAGRRRRHEAHVGPEVFHVYELSNRGPTDIAAAEAYILWPSYTLPSDQHLLYLLEQPTVEGPGTCDPVPGVNPLQLQLEQSRPAQYLAPPSSQRQPNELELQAAPPSPWRRRRSTESDFQADLGCGATICTIIYCRIGRLTDKESVIIRIRSRLWVETIEKETRYTAGQEVAISSRTVARVTALPYSVDPSYMNHTSLVVTSRVFSDGVRSAPVPWWVIVLASCGGVLILLLLCLLLYRLGFFKRRRRPDAATSAANGTSGANGANGAKPIYYGYEPVPQRQAGDQSL